MHIAFDYQIFLSQKYGGISRYHVELGKELKKIDCRVDFISPFFINQYLKNIEGDNIFGKYISSLPPKSTRVLTFLSNILFVKYLKTHNPDLIHNTYYRTPYFQQKDLPSILTIHDMIHELYPKSFPADDKTIELKKRAINDADHIICISKNTYNDLLNIYDVPENKVSVIYHGFNNIVRKVETEVNEEKPYLLYVGSRKGYKNFNALLEAYSFSENLKKDFDIICFGGGSFTKQDMNEFSKLGVQNKIHFKTGDDALLSAYYSNAKAFVYPSLYEGFGMPPLEAMANNCPVIVSNSSSIPEVVGEAGEYFDPNDEENLLNKIEQVVYSNSVRIKLIKLGRNRLEKFDWIKCARETKKVYEKLI